jgi:hypothetical protein
MVEEDVAARKEKADATSPSPYSGPAPVTPPPKASEAIDASSVDLQTATVSTEESPDPSAKSSNTNNDDNAAAVLELHATPKINNAKIIKSTDADAATAAATAAALAAANPRNLPQRNASSDSMRSGGPLPSIEECLFGTKDQQLAMKEFEEQRKKQQQTGKSNNDTSKDAESEENNTLTLKTSIHDEDYFVPLNLLRRVSSQGIEDDDYDAGAEGGSHRALAWRVLLGYLPPDRREWSAVANQQRQSYHQFVQELFCVEPRDLDGKELRGHHSKRHRNKQHKEKTKKERRERRKNAAAAANGAGKDASATSNSSDKNGGEPSNTIKLPVKFVDDSNDCSSVTLSAAVSASEDDNNEDENECTTVSSNPGGNDSKHDEQGGESSDNEKNNIIPLRRLNSSDLLQDDPTKKWNMTVREQKILERLTSHDAVNQLLVKRDCIEWNNFLENATLLDEIRKDVNRTHPHLYFYLEPHKQLGARRYGALERILFVWAKLNKGVRT